MSENRNNNQNSVQKYDNQIKAGMRNLNAMKENRKRECNHKACGQGRILALYASNIDVPNKKDMPESTVICTRCERYFECEAYSADETDSGIYMFTSMAEQVKLNAQLSEEDKKSLEEYYAALDVINNFTTYYHNMVEKLSNGGGNKNKGNRQSKGHMGVTGSMFGGRGY